MSIIHFKTTLLAIGSWTILRLPKEASAKLPSRGQTMIKGTIDGFNFQTALEPDGEGSHWFRIDHRMQKAAKAAAGDTVTLAIESTKEWPEPNVPADLQKALVAAPQVRSVWTDITPMARWDWIRWIGATSKQETRKRRIEVALSKLKSGERRPCCFNRTVCTVPEVSKNGTLLSPARIHT